MKTPPERVGFGGGCHWCTEAEFQMLRGVSDVDQGFVRASAPHDGWSEAVVVTFYPDTIDLKALIEVHLRTHASTSRHKMRGKYRSAVYCFDGVQAQAATDALHCLQAGFPEPLVTCVLPHMGFRPSDGRFNDYYATNPDRPFCRTYIDPKLRLIRETYGDFVRPEGEPHLSRSGT